MARNGLPGIMGISLSSSISNTMKFVGKKKNLSTFTRTSSIIPLRCFKDRSTNYSVTVVGLASPNPIFLMIVNDIRFILSPKSHSAFSNMPFPMEHGIVKLPGSCSFYGNFSIKLHYTLLIRPVSHNP